MDLAGKAEWDLELLEKISFYNLRKNEFRYKEVIYSSDKVTDFPVYIAEMYPPVQPSYATSIILSDYKLGKIPEFIGDGSFFLAPLYRDEVFIFKKNGYNLRTIKAALKEFPKDYRISFSGKIFEYKPNSKSLIYHAESIY